MESYFRLARKFCCSLLLCGLVGPASGQAQPAKKLAIDDRVYVASKVFALLQAYFHAPETGSVLNSDASYRTYLQKVLANDDRRQFDLDTMEFVAQLHSGHTFFSDTWLTQSYGQPLGFFVAPLGDAWVVLTSSGENPRRGDVLVNIDGIAMEDFFRQRQRYIHASSAAAQRHILFLLPYLFPLQFRLTLKDGRSVLVDRLTAKDPHQETNGHWLDEAETAYISVPSFVEPTFEDQALDYIRQFQSAKQLFIDIRNNSGGVPPERLIRALMDRPYRGWKESTSLRVPLFDSHEEAARSLRTGGTAVHLPSYSDMLANYLGKTQLTWEAEFVPPSSIAFHGRLILLIDGGCVSACEDFVEPFKDNGRATLVGETTQGSSGLPFFYEFHNGMSIKIAVKREFSPDGSEFEGIGIKPDIEVRPSIDDLRSGRDVVLKRALELVQKR